MDPFAQAATLEVVKKTVEYLLDKAQEFLKLRKRIEKGEEISKGENAFPIDSKIAEDELRWKEREIKGLKEQLEIHHRRLLELDKKKTFLGMNAPVDIELQIEDEKENLRLKGKQLKEFLEQAKGSPIEIENLF